MRNKILTIIVIIIIIVIGLIYFYQNYKQKDINKYSFKNPVIPDGFFAVDTEQAKWERNKDGTLKDWNRGLVIEDSIGNQFIWIPVDLENINYDDIPVKIDSEYTYNIKEFNSENKDENQILKYGGFYLSRYEAGVSDTMQENMTEISSKTNDIVGKPTSKKERLPWNYISLKNAKINAQNMYVTNNISSDLPTLKQMQYVCMWLYKAGYDVYNDSSKFGNYSNVNFKFTGYYSENNGMSYEYGKDILKSQKNMILSSGSTDRNMTNNLYDIAGNLWEYTDDYFQINEKQIMGYYCVGGHYDNTGDSYPAYSSNLKNVYPLEKVGFRISLFLKN